MIEDMSVHGEITRLAVTLEPVRDKSGAVMGFAQNIRDVTKYYAYAADLAADDRALANAARLAHYGVVIVDVETTQTTFANGGAKERLGLRRDLALPAGVKIARLTPEWTDRAWSEWLTGVNPGEDAVRQDVIVFDAAQKTVRADLYAAVVVEVERRLAVVRVFENSERLAALEDLRRRSRQLAISNRDLEQFASVVAHDLRAPLRHINQFSEFLRSEVGAATLGEAGEHLRMIEESADAMSEMIEALLDYARLDRAARNFQTLDLRHCAERAVRLIGDETLQVEWRLDAPPPIVGDETLIVRLFLNLIGNAVKYAAPEIGPAVRIEAYEAGMSAVIAVSDKGIGVKPAHAEKIFKLFQRLHTEDEYPGLGVGLATCRRICELHGGGIELDKSYEGGARFIVTLPTAVRDEEEASPPYAAQ